MTETYSTHALFSNPIHNLIQEITSPLPFDYAYAPSTLGLCYEVEYEKCIVHDGVGSRVL